MKAGGQVVMPRTIVMPAPIIVPFSMTRLPAQFVPTAAGIVEQFAGQALIMTSVNRQLSGLWRPQETLGRLSMSGKTLHVSSPSSVHPPARGNPQSPFVPRGVGGGDGATPPQFKLHRHRVTTEDNIDLSIYEKIPSRVNENTRIVLLIHSATFSSLPEYDLQIKDYSLMDYLAKAGFRVFAVDIRGYGDSDKPPSDSWITADVAVKDVLATAKFIRQRTGSLSFSILGWSWGTQVAGLFTQNYPEYIDGLILYAPFWRGVSTAIPAPTSTRNDNTAEIAMGDFLDMSYTDRDVVIEFARQCMIHDRTSPCGSWRDLRSLRMSPILDPAIITTPVLMIYGEHDHLVIKEDIAALYEAFASKQKRFAVIRNADHMAHLENNHRAFFDELRQFLEQ